jgi:hypothetical protein
MLSFLAANAGTLVVALVLILVVAAVIVHLVRQKKQGGGCCDCGCEGCASAGMCHPQQKKH